MCFVVCGIIFSGFRMGSEGSGSALGSELARVGMIRT